VSCVPVPSKRPPSLVEMMGDSFSLHYSGSSANHQTENIFPIDPEKAVRLEQRLTASTGLSMSIEKEDIASEEEYQGMDDESRKSCDGKRIRKRFSPEEDRSLIEGFSKFGNDWEKIISWANLERNPEQIKRRLGRIKKKRSPPSGDASTEPPQKIPKLVSSVVENFVESPNELPDTSWEKLKEEQELLKVRR